MSTLKVDTILKRTGTGTITLGQSGDTITVPSGATMDLSNATQTGVGVSGTESFFVSKTGSDDQNITQDTYTKVTFDNEAIDVGSNFASNKYTAPSAGKYFFNAQVKAQSNLDGGVQAYTMALYKNGTMIGNTDNQLISGNQKKVCKNVNLILDLATNDYIEVYIFLSRSSGSVTLHVYGDSYYGTHFTGFKLA